MPAPAARADFVGVYAGNTVNLAGKALSINGQPLEPAGGDVFVAGARNFDNFPLLFVREKGAVVAIDHGGRRLVRDGASAPLPPVPARLAARAGVYESDDPWIGGITITARGDQLLIGGTDALAEIGDDVWRADPGLAA